MDGIRSSCQAMMPNASYPRKRSFLINSIVDYRYRLSSHAFPLLITRNWYGSLAIGSIRCIPIIMLIDAKIEYYSFIGLSAGEEHDGDSIFLHIIVFRSLDNGLLARAWWNVLKRCYRAYNWLVPFSPFSFEVLLLWSLSQREVIHHFIHDSVM